MSISGKQVGTDIVPVVLLGDPSVASQVQSVIPIVDATNPTGKFAGLNLTAIALKDVGGNLDIAKSTPGAINVPAVATEGTKNTYSSASYAFTPAATATDFYTIIGSGTKTVRILRITISGFATAAISVDVNLLIRSTADSAGAATNPVIVPNDPNNAGATAVISLWGANPTLGVLTGVIRSRKLNLGTTGNAGTIDWRFTDINDQAIVLRGVAQQLALNWNGAAVPAGTSLDIDIEFVEDNS